MVCVAKRYACVHVCVGVQYMSAPRSSHTPLCQLPHWCVYVGHLGCGLIATTGVALTVAQGLHLPMLPSLRWLLTTAIAVLMGACVLDPIRVLVVAFVNAMLGNTLDVDVHRFVQPQMEVNLDPKVSPSVWAYHTLQ